MSKKLEKFVQCMFCGHTHALLKEEPSWMNGVHRAYIRCTNCDIAFVANFNEKTWAQIKKVQALSKLGA